MAARAAWGNCIAKTHCVTDPGRHGSPPCLLSQKQVFLGSPKFGLAGQGNQAVAETEVAGFLGKP